ncbi:MAG: helix-turn-helix transcriptional regulator [Bauldia sp.]
MATSTAARAEARLKQLCCLDLAGEAVIPALLAELHTLVPYYWARVFLVDEGGRITNSYDEHPDAHLNAAVYWQEFHGRPGRELAGTFPDIIRTQIGVRDLEETLGQQKIDLNSFRRSEFYNLIYRTTQIDLFLRLIVREGGRGRPLGVVTMHRALGEDRWTAEEKRKLGDLEPFLAHAMTTRGKGAALVDSGRTGLIIADRAGKMISCSAQGGQLLFLAMHERVTSAAPLGQPIALPPPLAKLCRGLSGIFADDPTASAPTHHHRNAWGGFQFRAHWLDRSDPDSGLIGIVVNHKEPLKVRLVRRIGELPLNGREAEVCLHLASGSSNEAIADQLGISKHTAITHGRWIYSKLGVHNRAELVSKLLAPPGPN